MGLSEAVSGHLQAAIDRTPVAEADKITLNELEHQIAQGACRLWLDRHSVAVTECVGELEARGLHMAALAGGKLEELIPMLLQAEAMGRALGMDQMVIEDGRPGWEAVLKKHGYRRVTRLVKEL